MNSGKMFRTDAGSDAIIYEDIAGLYDATWFGPPKGYKGIPKASPRYRHLAQAKRWLEERDKEFFGGRG